MPLIITILLMGILGGAEIDIFVPSFPELQQTFHLSPFMVTSTLAINLIAHCLASLLVGNLGDRYGRRPIIIYGLVIFIVGSVSCFLATSFWHLFMGRFLQGIGISGPIVLSYVILADIYTAEKQQKMLGVLNGIMSLAMGAAPVAGSYTNLYYGWRGSFGFLLFFSILCLFLATVFLPQSQKNLKVSLSLKGYKSVFQSQPTLYFIATIILSLQGYWIFIGMSSIFYREALGVSLKHFGFYQGTLATIFALVSFGSGFLLKKFGQKNCFFSSLAFLFIFTAAISVLIAVNSKSPLLITTVMCINSLGIIFPLNILWPLMLDSVPTAKARISAICISARLIVTAFSIMLAGKLYDGTLWSFGSIIVLFTILAFWACYKLFQTYPVFKNENVLLSKS